MAKETKKRQKEKRHVCPYCDVEIVAAQLPYCQPCGVVLRYCVKCNTVMEKTAKVCPQCGQPLE